MGKVKDMIGIRYNKLVAIERLGKGNNGYNWLFKCDCGVEKTINGSVVRTGAVVSCGCHKREQVIKRNTKHGAVGTGTYNTWQGMNGRCNNPNHSAYKNYGGRGILVCLEWKDFSQFLTDMDERPEGMTLDRIDNTKGYSKDNCKWATTAEQSRNTRQNVLLTLKDRTMCLMDWAKETNIPYTTLQWRIKQNQTTEQILCG